MPASLPATRRNPARRNNEEPTTSLVNKSMIVIVSNERQRSLTARASDLGLLQCKACHSRDTKSVHTPLD